MDTQPDPVLAIEFFDKTAADKANRLAAFDAEEERLGKEVARQARIGRSADFLFHTPHWMIPTADQQKAKREEAAMFEIDLANAMWSGIPFNQLANPQSIRGKEAKKAVQLAKRRITDKARRDRKRATQ